MVWFFLKKWNEQYQGNSTDLTIWNVSIDSGLTDINVLKDPPAFFFLPPNIILTDEEKFNKY